MRKSFSALAALALAAGMAPSFAPTAVAQEVRSVEQGKQQPAKQAEQRAADRRTTPFRGGWGSPLSGRDLRRARPGWSNRQVKRMAAKRRNQARNRKACR